MSLRVGGSQPSINLTPLIDVLLVLLIIFMVISPAVPKQLETKTPQAGSETPEKDSKRSVLVISMAPSTLELSLNGKPMKADELQTLLAEELNRRPVDMRAVFIKAPKAALYREVVRVIDLAKGAGAVPTGLQIDYLED